MDPLFKSYPFYTPYQFAGNKPIMATDRDGMEEWVAIFLNSNDKKPSSFRYAPELQPLGAGQIYKRVLDAKPGQNSLSIYDVNKKATVNVAFIPDFKAVLDDEDHTNYHWVLSAYYQDSEFFKDLDSKSDNFAAIAVKDLQDMAFKGVAYAMENNVAIKDIIIDFHGTQLGNNDVRFDGQPHRLSIGNTVLTVDKQGKADNYTEREAQLFQLLAKFRPQENQTLLGACNADKCIDVLKLMGKDMNTTIYGHKSYSYSTNLDQGKFYGAKLSYIFHDGGRRIWGQYVKVLPDGTVMHVGGIRFSTQSQTAGDISQETQE